MSTLSEQKKTVLKQRKRRRAVRNVMIMAAILVAGSIGITLRQPAVTATPELVCGLEEHTHSEECYGEETLLSCGLEEFEGHVHSDDCYAQEQVQVCELEEGEEHAHSEECFVTNNVLICEQEESTGHAHSDECYTNSSILTCSLTEHTHDESCYEQGGVLTSQTSDQVIVEVSYEAGVLHNGSSLSARSVDYSSVAETTQRLNEQLAAKNQMADTVEAYDLTISRENSIVQPDGAVSVSLTFQTPVTATNSSATWRLYYDGGSGSLSEIGEESRVSISTSSVNAVTGVSFNTTHFSQYVLAAVADMPAVNLEIETETEAEIETETEVEIETETEAEIETETEVEIETETEVEVETETEVEIETETEAEIETESCTENSIEEVTEYPVQQFEGNAGGIAVTVNATDGAFPEGTIMKVTKVLDDELLMKAIDVAGAKNAKAIAVDITFTDANGQEIEPTTTIRVTMKADVVAETNDITIVHVDDNDQMDVVKQTSNQELSNEEKPSADEVIFDSDAFSTYAIVYTVDFSYGEYAYSINGGSDILLSKLMESLHIYNAEKILLTASDVSSIEFSDESLVKITEENGEWRLISLQAFSSSETLTLKLRDGAVITIDVTDEQTISDLGNYVSSISIEGATKNDDGSYTVSAGDPYSLKVYFNETNDYQFTTDGSLTYQLPTGFTVSKEQNGIGSVDVDTGSVPYTYTVDTSGKVTIFWPTDHSDHQDQWKELLESQYMKLEVEVAGVFESTATELEFSADASGKVQISNNHNLSVLKTGTYNEETNQVDYTITVTSTGHNTNIVVTDVINGSALTYREDSFKSENSSNKVTRNGNGFIYTVDSMNNGESFNIYYSADVNLDGIKKGTDGNYNGTFDETGNTVTVTGDDIPEPPTDKVEGADFNNKISYSTLIKSASAEVEDTDNDLVKRVTWTIKVNENANVSMAGKTISDAIADDSKSIMHYSGTGIIIVVKDKSGNVVDTRDISWSKVNMTSENDSDWVYTVPEKDGNYSYEITYTTDVSVSETDSTTVNNGAGDSNGNHADGSITIDPTAGLTTIKKEYTGIDIDNYEITWKITLEVPSVGYDTYVVSDYYPHQWDGSEGKEKYFTYKGNSIIVTGLTENESYLPDETKEDHLLITFFKDQNQNNQGLERTDEPREITITITTVMSEFFVNTASKDENVHWADNNAYVYPNDKQIHAKASAPVQFSKKTMTKTTNGWIGENTVNGVQLPMIRYDVIITGVNDSDFDTEGNLILTDTFDNEYFTWLPITYNDNGYRETSFNGWVYGSDSNEDQYNAGNKSSAKVLSLSDGKLMITLNKDTIPKKAGEYYYRYVIPYILTVKSAEALEALNIAAGSSSGGIYTITNKVENEKYGSKETSVNYTTNILTKEASTPSFDSNTGNYIVNYKLNLNPLAQQLGTENSLQVLDESENLTIDLSSIEAIPSLGVSWNLDKNNRLVFTIPNAMNVQITYKAKIIGTGVVAYSNKATLYGQEKSAGGSYDFTSDSHGSAVTYKMNILKYESGDIMTVLEGAEFDLYMLRDADKPAADGKESQPAEIDGRWVKINDDDNPFITNEKGLIEITAASMQVHDSYNKHEGKGLYHSCWYMLKEKSAPIVNGVKYKLDETPYMFWIDEMAKADYSNSIYVNNDTITVSNTPIEEDDKKLGFTIKKLWKGVDASDLPDSITIRIYQKDSIYSSNETATEISSITLEKSDFNNSLEWTGEFKNLEKGKAYFIKEDPLDEYITTYEEENTIGYTRNGSISLTNGPIPDNPKPTGETTEVKIEKKWLDSSGNKIEDASILEKLSAQFELVRYRKKAEGTVIHFLLDSNGNGNYSKLFDDVVVSSSGEIQLEFSVDTDNIYARIGHTENQKPSGNFWNLAYLNKSSFTNETATFSLTTKGEKDIYLVFHQQAESFKGVKITQGALLRDSSSNLDGYTIDPDFYPERITLPNETGWSYSFSDLAVLEAGADETIYSYKYLLTEKSSSDGFEFKSYVYDNKIVTVQSTGISTAGSADKVITVSNQQENTTTDFRFTKIWKDVNDNEILWIDNQSITVTLEGIFTPKNGASSTQSWKYKITRSGDQYNVQKKDDSAPDISMEQNQADEKKYIFTISDLPENGTYNESLGTWTYTLTEDSVEGYETQYYSIGQNGSLLIGTTEDKINISSDEAIVNKQIAYYTLPKTGGIGTFKFILGGLSLMMIALLLLWRNYIGREAMGIG